MHIRMPPRPRLSEQASATERPASTLNNLRCVARPHLNKIQNGFFREGKEGKEGRMAQRDFDGSCNLVEL